jgi:HNH endonuclease.
MRHEVWKRDRGVCALCGLDTKSIQVDRPRYWGARHKWEADHIVPVSEGGGLCGLEGYRTLCRGTGTNNCHGKVSGALRKRLKEGGAK